MTKSEFVRISSPEKVYGEQNLLNAQLELLNLVKSFQTFRELRNEELVLKVTLKNKVEETLGLIDKFERILPKAHYEEKREEKEERKRKQDRRLSLQEEIAEVREKLARLRSGDL